MTSQAPLQESLFQQLSRNIYEKCTDALRRIGCVDLAALASCLPAAMMVVGGAVDSAHASHIAGRGYDEYLEYVRATKVDGLIEGVARSLSGGFKEGNGGAAIFWAGAGGLAAFPALALAAKALVHACGLRKSELENFDETAIQHDGSGPTR